MKGATALAIYQDEELMAMSAGGDVRAIEELYARYSRRLFAYLIRMLNGDRPLAEDLLQDVFLKIAESPASFDPGRSFKTWIFCVAHNRCMDHYRKQKVRREDELEMADDLPAHIDLSGLARKLDAAAFRNMLEKELEDLPAEKREAFILKYQEDRSIAEIAYIQGCPEGSVKSRLHYTIKVLAERLKMFNPVK
jgi:RNA polymerase sigma-70 factor, ECF subfamily